MRPRTLLMLVVGGFLAGGLIGAYLASRVEVKVLGHKEDNEDWVMWDEV